jgi:hypothetical protein
VGGGGGERNIFVMIFDDGESIRMMDGWFGSNSVSSFKLSKVKILSFKLRT